MTIYLFFFKVFPIHRVKKSLSTIYKMNVQGFNDGMMGAVNGMMPDGNVDTYSVQSEEVWTGVTYALSSLMISHVSFFCNTIMIIDIHCNNNLYLFIGFARRRF